MPAPILDDHPALVDLWWRAWDLAAAHVVERDDLPVPRYLDEGFDPDRLWIWDSALMVQFARWAPDALPAADTLELLHQVALEGASCPLRIQHPDNPPLLAWAELELLRTTGDLERVERILECRWPQRWFEAMAQPRRWRRPRWAAVPTTAGRRHGGYVWSGVASGMDDTPRGGGFPRRILWFDLLAQQALAATSIAQLHLALGDEQEHALWEARADALRTTCNALHWDDVDGCYHDVRSRPPHEPVRVLTPATFWPLLAGACSPERAERLAQLAADPDRLGGDRPFPSVDRSHHAFHADGRYWRGSVWVPLAHVATTALRRAGHVELAADLALRVVEHQRRTLDAVEPHTLWEAYSPSADEPATGKHGWPRASTVRPDFCGWSALGPISMLLEHVIGIHEVDAVARRVRWHRRPGAGRHGVKGLRVGDLRLDLESDGRLVTLRSSGRCTLELDGATYDVPAGVTQLRPR